MAQQTQSTVIDFRGRVRTVATVTLVELPVQASGRLPSRGQVAAGGAVNGVPIRTVVEPDGARGHWLRLDADVVAAAGLSDGDRVDVRLEPTKEWPEPEVPADLAAALATASPGIHELWNDITPMARWEWVRWVGATANPATRQRRVEVTISKMDSGKRRPCCFDLSACTEPAVARNGKLT